MSEHPKYQNDIIQEALCELRLVPSDDTVWGAKTPGQIFKELGPDKFPGMEPISEVGIELHVDQTGQPQQKLIQGPPKFRFINSEETILVQVSPVLFTFNCVKEYPEWENMKNQTIENWDIVRDILKPKAIEKVGLRYINRIPNRIPINDSTQTTDWFKPCRYIPEGIGQSQGDLKYHFESGLSDTDRIIIKLINQKDESGKEVIFFDIDRIKLSNGLPEEKEFSDIMEELHNDIWDVFSEAKTDRLEDYLNQSPKEDD